MYFRHGQIDELPFTIRQKKIDTDEKWHKKKNSGSNGKKVATRSESKNQIVLFHKRM